MEIEHFKTVICPLNFIATDEATFNFNVEFQPDEVVLKYVNFVSANPDGDVMYRINTSLVPNNIIYTFADKYRVDNLTDILTYNETVNTPFKLGNFHNGTYSFKLTDAFGEETATVTANMQFQIVMTLLFIKYKSRK